MKRIYTLLLSLLSVCVGYAQTDGEEGKEKSVLGNTWEMLKEMSAYYSENLAMGCRIDSMIHDGMYMRAIEEIDSFQVKMENVWGRAMSETMYVHKGQVLAYLEEYEKIVENADECLQLYNLENDVKTLSVLYEQKGLAYLNMKDYRMAVRSYERVVSYSTQAEDTCSVANAYCTMAYCYSSMNKSLLASSYYENGFDKYGEYFNISRSYLLKHKLQVSGSEKNMHKSIFANHLLGKALFEQKRGDKGVSKKYLRMSANCGSELAQREYRRLYGD